MVVRRGCEAAAALVVAALFGAHGCAPQPGPWIAASRPAELLVDGRPQAVATVELAHQVRSGLCLAVGQEVRVSVPPGCARLAFAFGRRGAVMAGRVRFSVRAAGAAAPAPAFEAVVEAGDTAWHDGRVEVRAQHGQEVVLASQPVSDGPAVTGQACWGGVVFARRDAGAADRPNVILLSLDTLGAAYLSSFGGPAGSSPAIDQVLALGHHFRRAFASYPNTFVSHSSLFSGQLPARHGRYADTDVPFAFPRLESLVDPLAEAGYVVAGFTENAFVGSSWGFARGFDLYDNGESRRFELPGDARGTFEKGLAWLDRQGRDTRFFLFLHTYEVHSPYAPADETGRRFADALTPDDRRTYAGGKMGLRMLKQSEGPTFDARDFRRLEALYSGEVNYLDRQVGALLGSLEERGLLADTLLVITSDHGEAFGQDGFVGHGHTLHNSVLHVPLSFVWKDRIRPGEHGAPVQLVDVFPTILELAGLPIPGDLDGRSLVHELRGGGARPPRPAFAELRWKRLECDAGDADCRVDLDAVQTTRFKLVRARDGSSRRLYDLTADPGETTDVAAAHPEVVQRLEQTLVTGLRQAGPPAGPQERAPLDPAMHERLRALGYVGD